MMTKRRVHGAMAAALLLFTGACAQPAVNDRPGDGGSGPDMSQPDELVLRVELVGGFLSTNLLMSRLPMLSVYGDGRVLTQGAQIEIFPAPALPSVQVQQISATDVRKLTELALRAGVGEQVDYGQPGITDVPTTRFTVLTGAGQKQTEVYALSEATDDGPGLTPAQLAARQKLRDLLAQLTDLQKTLGQSVPEAKLYEPAGLAVFATPYAMPQTPDPVQPKIAWPGPALPGVEVSKDLQVWCLDVTGADTKAVLSAAAKANAATPWSSAGKEWTVVFRPVLPDETGCSDLVSSK